MVVLHHMFVYLKIIVHRHSARIHVKRSVRTAMEQVVKSQLSYNRSSV